MAGLLALLAAAPAWAGASFVIDTGSKVVLHAHLSEQRWPPASLTKLMTVYVVFEKIRSGRLTMQSPVTISARANAEPYNRMDFPVGHQIPLEEAIKLLLVKSANDVAVAVAESVSGSVEAFADEMNRTAKRIGMTESHFVNPNGLYDADHYSSARDLGILAMAIWSDFPEYGPLFSLPSLTVGGETMKNYNPLLDGFPGADGMKTGYVCQSGYNLVGSASQAGHRIIAVILGAQSEAERAKVAKELMQQAFAGPRPAGSAPGGKAKAEPVNLAGAICGKSSVPASLRGF